MASTLNSTQHNPYQSFKSTELTPPPSPGKKDAEAVRYAANTGKLRRSKVPENLLLVGSNYDALSKHAPSGKSQGTGGVKTIEVATRFPPALKTSTSIAAISPLTTADFDLRDNGQISKPGSAVRTEFKRKDIPISPSLQDFETPTIAQFRFARPVPMSQYSSKNPSRANTVKANDVVTPRLPPLNTALASPSPRQPISTKQQGAVEKNLPPPPPKDPSPQRTIAPVIDPDTLPMPGDAARIKKQQDRVLRTVQSIGVLHSGPKTGDSTITEFRPSSFKPIRPFHRRFFTGINVFSSLTNKGAPSIHSVETATPSFTRRMSHLSRRKDSVPDDPLLPVSTLPVMTNAEDVAGGLTYLPRYTNNFAGFCKNAWRLQLSDAKAFDIKNRNSTRQMPLLKCTKCPFECPLYPQRVLGDRYVWARIPDSRVYSSFGVTYTWQFLFKSHLAQKKKAPKVSSSAEPPHPLIPPLPKPGTAEVDMADGLFGCIFCCVQGLGTPVFKGPEALSWHIRSHVNDRVVDLELQHRFKIIIGREPAFNEKFDVHIPHVSNNPKNGASMSVSVGGNGQWEGPSNSNPQSLNPSAVVTRAAPSLKTPGQTMPSTPLLNVDIQNEQSWELKNNKNDPDQISTITNDRVGMWSGTSTPYVPSVC